jgi:hypothetical protein
LRLMIKLDPIRHCVEIGSRTLNLQPLTYDLFAKLYENAEQILTVQRLTHEVWEGVVVSPETLKQRIFLLRKALESAGADPKIIQSVRGKGYRLILPRNDSGRFTFSPRSKILTALGLLLAGLLLVWFFEWFSPDYEFPANNRVAFWTTSSLQSMDQLQIQRQQAWITALTTHETIAFVTLSWNPDIDLSSQARKARVAVVSYWQIFEVDNRVVVRIQIIEPKTATVLRSELLTVNDEASFNAEQQYHIAALNRLVQSGVLPLPREALEDTDHPAWEKLRLLANTP